VTTPIPELVCEVCDKNPGVGVAAVPGVPISVAYCRECLEANAHPYWIVVTNTAMIGGLDHTAEWWVDIVTSTLAHLDITREQFDADVALQAQEWAEEEAKGADPDRG